MSNHWPAALALHLTEDTGVGMWRAIDPYSVFRWRAHDLCHLQTFRLDFPGLDQHLHDSMSPDWISPRAQWCATDGRVGLCNDFNKRLPVSNHKKHRNVLSIGASVHWRKRLGSMAATTVGQAKTVVRGEGLFAKNRSSSPLSHDPMEMALVSLARHLGKLSVASKPIW